MQYGSICMNFKLLYTKINLCFNCIFHELFEVPSVTRIQAHMLSPHGISTHANTQGTLHVKGWGQN